MRSKLNSIKAICEEGDRSGADRLDEIYQIAIDDGPDTVKINLVAIGLVHTPKDWDELNAWIDRHARDERAHLMVAACMTWNLASKLVTEAGQADEEVDAGLILDPRELAAVLSGLRMLQEDMAAEARDGVDYAEVAGTILTDGGTLKPVTITEIDKLCERLNR